MIAQRKRYPVAALMMDGAFVDGDDALRLKRIVPQDQALAPRGKYERDLAAEGGLRRRRNQRRDADAEQPRQVGSLIRKLLRIRNAWQRAATADAEVLALQAT